MCKGVKAYDFINFFKSFTMVKGLKRKWVEKDEEDQNISELKNK
jgi:hypothetical protein